MLFTVIISYTVLCEANKYLSIQSVIQSTRTLFSFVG